MTQDLVLMVLDAAKEDDKNHKAILEAELEAVGIRLNQDPPDISFTRKLSGGIGFHATYVVVLLWCHFLIDYFIVVRIVCYFYGFRLLLLRSIAAS